MVYLEIKKNPDDIMLALAKKIDVHITSKDISISHRLHNANQQNNSPTIIAKFLSRKIRNQFFDN